MYTNFDDLYSKVLEILPNATLGEDSDGQIVVNTNLTIIEDDGSIQDMDELAEIEGIPCADCGAYPGDPHNPEAHIAEMRAAEYAMYEPRDPYDEPYGDEVLLDPEECGREHAHKYNTHTRNGMMYCSDCDTELGIVCAVIVYVDGWGEGPCGLLKDDRMHVNPDDSRAIDHEYIPAK